MTVSFATPSAVNMLVTAFNGVNQIGTWTGNGVVSVNFAVVPATYYISIVDVNNNQYTPYTISWNINVAAVTSSPITTSPLTSGQITTGRRVTTGRITTGRTTGLVTTEFPNSGRSVTTFHSKPVCIVSTYCISDWINYGNWTSIHNWTTCYNRRNGGQVEYFSFTCILLLAVGTHVLVVRNVSHSPFFFAPLLLDVSDNLFSG